MTEAIGNNRRIAKNTLFLYFRMGVSMIISLYTARVVLATLGETDYGIFNVVTGCVAMFTFLNGALSGSASRFLAFEIGAQNKERLRNTFSATLVVHVLLAAIIVLLSETIGLWFLENKLIIPQDRMYGAMWAYQISVLMIVVSMIQVPYSALIIAHEKMNIYAYVTVFDIGTRLALVFLLQVLPGDKLIIWAWMLLMASTLYCIIYIIYANKNFREARLRFHRQTALYKRLLSYAWWDLIGNLSGMLQGQGINIVLNMFYGPVVNAARGISYQVQGALNQFASNFTVASKPQIIKLYAAGQIEEMMRLVYLSGCLAFYLSWLFTLPLSLELKYVLKLWLGTYPDYTISFTLITMLTGLIVSIKSSRVSAIHATGQIKLTNISVGLILCSAFPLAYIALKLGYNPTSALIICAVVTLAAEVVAIFVLRKYVKFSIIRYWVSVYGRCCVVAIISSLLPTFLHYIMQEGFLRLTVVCMTSIISVGITVLIVGFSSDNRRIAIDIIKMKLPKLRLRHHES